MTAVRWAFHQLLSTFVSSLLVAAPALAQTEAPRSPSDAIPTASSSDAGEQPAIHLARVRARLVSASDRLDAFLKKYDRTDEGRWKSFLNWRTLRQQLDAAAPSPEVLEGVAARFYRNQVGLERSEFTDVRTALKDYADAVRVSNADDAELHVRNHRELLTLYLEACESGSRPLDAEFVAESVLWLEAAGRHPELTREVRGQFDYPNALIHFQGDAINYVVERELKQSSTISEWLFGAAVYGSADTTGVVSTELDDDEEVGAFDLVIKAIVDASTNSSRRNVRVYNDSKTNLEARKRIYVDEFGVHTRPAEATGSTQTVASSVYARLRLIRRLATRRVQSLTPQAEAMAAERAARQLEEELDGRIDEQVELVSRYFREHLREPAVRIGIFPSSFLTRSRNNVLEFEFLLAEGGRFGAPRPASALRLQHAFSFAAHESAFNNTIQPLFSGKTITDEDLAIPLQQIFGTVPRPFRLGTHLERWSFTLAEQRPVEVRFADQVISMAVHAASFQIGDRRREFPVVIRAVYRPEITRFSFGFSLKRQSDVAYERSDGEPFREEDAEMLAFVKQKFDAFFLDTFGFESLSPPAGGAFEKLAKFKLKEVRVDEGWFMYGADRTQSSEQSESE